MEKEKTLEEQYEHIMDVARHIFVIEETKSNPDKDIIECSNIIFFKLLNLKPKIFK